MNNSNIMLNLHHKKTKENTNMFPTILYMIAINCGIIIAIQATMNAKISAALGWYGMLFSFTTSFLIIALLTLYNRPTLPTMDIIKAIPNYAWFGGLFGAIYVLSITYAAPQIGFTTTFILALSAQLLTSMFIEHFGFFDAPKDPFTIKKFAACVFIFIGAILAK